MQPELVRIKKAVSKERFRHLAKAAHPSERYPKGRISISDLLELQQWLKREDFGPKQRKWKERLDGGAHEVGFDSEVQTLLAKDQTAIGVDLAEIGKTLKDKALKKPPVSAPPKFSSADIKATISWGLRMKTLQELFFSAIVGSCTGRLYWNPNPFLESSRDECCS